MISYWVYLVTVLIIVVAWVVYAYMLKRKLQILEMQNLNLNSARDTWEEAAQRELERANRFKAKVIQQGVELDGLREAVERATIHQPPPTLGE